MGSTAKKSGGGLGREKSAPGAFAKVSLGQCLFTGTGARKDVAKATEWLTAALAPGADFSRPTPPPDFFAADPTKSVLLNKPTNRVKHTGGERIKPGTPQDAVLTEWVRYLATVSDEQVAAARQRLPSRAS